VESDPQGHNFGGALLGRRGLSAAPLAERDTAWSLKMGNRLPFTDGEGQERWITCERVVECFFSYLDFTKLVDAEALQDGISKGVEGGHFGYSICTTKPSEEAEPIEDESRLWFERRVDSSEIDLSDQAYLIAPSIAKKHVKAPLLPPAGPWVENLPATVTTDGEGREVQDARHEGELPPPCPCSWLAGDLPTVSSPIVGISLHRSKRSVPATLRTIE